MRNAKSLFTCSSIAALSLAFAGQALAADAVPGTISEVVVTAERTETLASKTPITLTAISGTDLRTAGITNPTNLTDSVPNLWITRAGGLQITIRGVTSTDQTEKGDPSASFLIDGVYIARNGAQDVSFFDIDRVEVLRGPQGTLYGRNTTAGVVNVISTKPKFDKEGSVDVAYGNYNSVQATGVINMPITDRLAVRVGINYDARDNFGKLGVPSAYELPKYRDNLAIRATALYNINDNMSLLFKADAAQIKGYGRLGVLISNFYQSPLPVPAAGAFGTDPTRIELGFDEQRKINFPLLIKPRNGDTTWGVHTEYNWDINPSITATYLGSYREYRVVRDGTDFRGDTFVNGKIATTSLAPNVGRNLFNQQSHEVRLAYTNDVLKVQGGIYYFRENYNTGFNVTGLLSPTPGTRGYTYGFREHGASRSRAAFVQATYKVTPKLRATAGLRYTDDDKYRFGNAIFHVGPNDPIDYTKGPNTTVNPRGFVDQPSNAHGIYGRTIGKIGLDYDLTESSMLYGSISTGYKAGGFNDGCEAGQPGCVTPITTTTLYYNPELITAYEAGVKSALFDRHLRINLSYFHYDYNNLQMNQASICGAGPCNVTLNAAKAIVDGVELEGQFAPDEHNRLDFSATGLNARFGDYRPIPTVNFVGKPLPRTPKYTFSAAYTYTQELANGGSISGSLKGRISDKYAFISTAARAYFWQPESAKADANITYNAPEKWYVQAFVNNIGNTIVLTNAATSGSYPGLDGGQAEFADPRTYGMRFGAKF